MAISLLKLFAPTVLGTAAAVVYTCPTSPTSSVVKNGRIRFTNTSGAVVTVTAYAVPSAGTPAAGNTFLNTYPISGNGYFDIDLPTLASGDTLQALASAATSITVHEIGGVISQ